MNISVSEAISESNMRAATQRKATTSANAEQIVTQTWNILRIVYSAVPVVAGADKFTNLLTTWENYLNPLVTRLLPISGHAFMDIVGIIEIAAGIVVFARPRLGAYVVTAWLVGIALNLITSGLYLDVAVRDLVMAVGAYSFARLTPVVQSYREQHH